MSAPDEIITIQSKCSPTALCHGAADADGCLSTELKLGLLNAVSVDEYPRVRFDESSRRHLTESSTRREMLQLETEHQLSRLSDLSDYPHIAIGGMNALGKSSFDCGRFYAKVNLLEGRLTQGSSYNHDVITSLEYLMLPHCGGLEVAQSASGQQWVCWDRSRYENLVFYFVSYLQHEYSSRGLSVPMPEPHERTHRNAADCEVLKVLNGLAHQCNLLQTLQLLELEHRVPTVFLVCSDLRYIGVSLFNRGGRNDVYNSAQWNYQAAQFHAYRYFASILQYPCLDFGAFVALDEDSMTLSTFHELVRSRINPRGIDFRRRHKGDEGWADLDVNYGPETPACVADVTALMPARGLREARDFRSAFDELVESTLVYSLSSK